MNVNRVEVHVGDLDISCFAPADAAALVQAFEHELEVFGRAASIGDLTPVPGRRVQITDVQGASAADLGIRAARAVIRELE